MTITHVQVSDAVRAAYSKLDAPHGAALDPRNYREGYWALCDLFRDHVCVQTWATAVAGATAVYGWMPRIFGRLNDYAAFADVLSDLRRASTCSEALKIVASSSRSEEVLRFVNGSVVGTSKFLHFLNPSAIPIWDSRVARNFGIEGAWHVDRVDRFHEYWAGMSGCHDQGPKAFASFCRSPDGRNVSQLRLMEYALFLKGVST